MLSLLHVFQTSSSPNVSHQWFQYLLMTVEVVTFDLRFEEFKMSQSCTELSAQMKELGCKGLLESRKQSSV